MERTHRFYYGWVIVGISSLTLFLSLGIRFSFGVFYVALLNEYGWGRGETAGAFSLALLTHGFFGMVSGNLIDRFGPRVLFPLGAIFLAMGLAAASCITAIWHLYLLFGIITAMGLNTLAYVPHMAIIPKWFVRRKGLAAGLALAGMGVGTMVMAPVIQFLIDTVGWRFAFLILAGIVLGVVVPMTALFQRRSPEDVGQFRDGILPVSGETHAPPVEKPPIGTYSPDLLEQRTLRAALHTRAFWWIALFNFSVGFILNTLVVHTPAHVIDVGYSAGLAAFVVGLVGLLRSGGGVLFGFLSDRSGSEIAYTVGGATAVVGVLLLLLVRDTASPWMVYTFAILFGLGSGSTGPIGAAVTADLFPGKSLGFILGISNVGYGLGGALGPYLAGYVYDHIGSYTFALIAGMAVTSLGVLAIWMAAPRRR
jgi:MFS family permease